MKNYKQLYNFILLALLLILAGNIYAQNDGYGTKSAPVADTNHYAKIYSSNAFTNNQSFDSTVTFASLLAGVTITDNQTKIYLKSGMAPGQVYFIILFGYGDGVGGHSLVYFYLDSENPTQWFISGSEPN